MSLFHLRALGLLSCLSVLAAGPAAAQASSPPSAVRGHVEAYVAAVNGEGEVAADAFRNEHLAQKVIDSVPRGAVIGFFTNQHRVLGGVELIGVRMVDEDTAEALLRGRLYGSLLGLTMDFESTPEQRVTEFDPGPAPAWAPEPKPAFQPAEIGARATALAERGCKAGVFSGAVLVAKGPEILLETGCGQANRRYGVANTARTRINLGSMNKMFTAVAVLQLAEAGRLSLDDPLSKYADETWLPAAVSDKITLRHLLTHTSGLGSFLGAEFEKSSPLRFRDLADFKPLVHGETPAFAPGSGYRYSNTGMLLLGVVIERASGETYLDYVRTHVFQPAGMTDTDSWPRDQPVADLAMGYGWAPQTPLGWRENTLRLPYRGGPAGDGFSTVGDLHRFALALQAGRLVSPASRTYLWTDHPPHDYGAGFMITNSVAGKIVGHEGMFSGVSSQLEIYLDKGYVVAILGNQDWAAPGLGDAIRGLIAQAK
jgi:CubicO group peptidase (beta-lactamase class C family)